MLAKPSVTMQYYHHEFPDIEGYLHHRDPYLLVDRIVSISATEVVTEKTVTGQEFCLQGHFPGAPIFPGAMIQELFIDDRSENVESASVIGMPSIQMQHAAQLRRDVVQRGVAASLYQFNCR